MLERFNLKNKVILLTGGAGLYGRGLTADLAAANATLIIASRNLSNCQKIADQENQLGHQVYAESYDQSSESSILGLRDRILERFGRIDGLVNNSVGREMKHGKGDLEGWKASMEVNATGIFLMHHHFGTTMQQQGSGSIVNIGSIQGMVGPSLNLYEGTGMPSGNPDYFFHKSGMLNLTRYYAANYGPSSVRVNCISPGGFENNQPAVFQERYNAQTFLGRMGNHTDLGGAVVFLLSDASLYITGINLPVDGGYTAK